MSELTPTSPRRFYLPVDPDGKLLIDSPFGCEAEALGNVANIYHGNMMNVVNKCKEVHGGFGWPDSTCKVIAELMGYTTREVWISESKPPYIGISKELSIVISAAYGHATKCCETSHQYTDSNGDTYSDRLQHAITTVRNTYG